MIIKMLIPSHQISGCNFHFARAIDTNVASKGLGELRKKCSRFGHAIRMFKALVFVPPTKFSEGFKVSIQTYNSFKLFSKKIRSVTNQNAFK